MNTDQLRYEPLDAGWTDALLDFLKRLQHQDEEQIFHPHPYTRAAVEDLIRDSRKDVYLLMVLDKQVIGYGMLRGWDEGYPIPSLGLAIHPDYREKGLGRKFMHHLHACAQDRGAVTIRLTVYSWNPYALKLFKDLGYRFEEPEGERLTGYLELA